MKTNELLRVELINILNNKIPSNWETKEDGDFIYIKKLFGVGDSKFTFPIIKCYRVSHISPPYFWTFEFTEFDSDSRKKFNIFDELVEDFLDVFLDRCDKYLEARKILYDVRNDIYKLSSSPKSEIRDYKINKVIKSENQE
jgi:hypothetical protein